MNKAILVLFVGLCTSIVFSDLLNNFERRCVVTLKENKDDAIFQDLEGSDFSLVNKVIKNNYIFDYQGRGNASELNELISHLKVKYEDMIAAIERVIVYNNTLKPGGVTSDHTFDRFKNDSSSGDENYYGMGVRRAWSLGYTGKGVTVAVTDVGIHTDLPDLKNNINEDLCYNFINDSKDIQPEYFHNLQAESAMYTGHGDHCASIIASTYGNEICSSGIAFNATIIGLKIYMVKFVKGVGFDLVPSYSSRSDIVARSLAYNQTIDIYSNAWAPMDPFIDLDTLTKEVLKNGAENGRRRLGMIYVFPAGPVGNGFANSIYTIAVNGVGQYGSIHMDSTISASVITSGLADGSNITASHMKTTSRNNKCVSSFNGVSPATAQVAAIISLALEANQNLTLRDVQHLLVHASEPVGTPGANNFTLNGAGRYFHRVFGFGLLNAGRLVRLAESMEPVGSLIAGEAKPVHTRYTTSFTQEVEFCYSCAIKNSSQCANKLEHVIINISFQTACGKLQIVLVSPDGTESVFIDLPKVPKKRSYTIPLMSVNFWDEAAFGKYHLKIIDGSNRCGRTKLASVSLILYGTYDHTVKERNYCSAKVHTTNGKQVRKDTGNALIYIGELIVFILGSILILYKINFTRTFIYNLYAKAYLR